MSHKHYAACLLATALVAVPAYVSVASAQEATQVTGEVRRVDAANGKITIRHGPIPELDLPAMTLVYKADLVLLTGIKPGDKIEFTAKREGGQYLVTQVLKK